MDNITFFQYHKLIHKGAFRKFSQKHGVADLIVSVLAVVVIGIVTDSLLNTLITILVLLAIYLLIYLYYFLKEPVAVFNEQISRIHAFWPQSLDVRMYDSSIRETLNHEGKPIPALVYEVVNGDKTRKMIELEAEIHHVAQSSIDKDDGPMTLSFFPEQKAIWEDSTTTFTLRPEGRALLYVAYLARRTEDQPRRLHFGESLYTSHLFDREAMYQIEIKFTAKMEGELEFKKSHTMRVIYANPGLDTLYNSDLLKNLSLYEEVPEPLAKVIEVAEQGRWLDYSSPYHRQQAEKQKEARDRGAQTKAENQTRTIPLFGMRVPFFKNKRKKPN